ncbi:MAG: hypothetical protein M3P96_01130, partial [Actinomycetota bacterium]|nr:hypothetical protein [Actinomycetota bacterium]
SAFWVLRGGEGCDGVLTGPGVALKRSQARVPALGHEQRQRDSGASQLNDRRVPKLVQGPPAGRCLKDLRRSPV